MNSVKRQSLRGIYDILANVRTIAKIQQSHSKAHLASVMHRWASFLLKILSFFFLLISLLLGTAKLTKANLVYISEWVQETLERTF